MALLTALRFNPRMGAMAIDQESWFLRRRKTFFSDCFYSVLPETMQSQNFELYYSGIGHPSFHYEVINNFRQSLSEKLKDSDWSESISKASRPIFKLSREVLQSFQITIRKRIDDRLQFLYGFDTSTFMQSNPDASSSSTDVSQSVVRKRALDIIEGKESLGYGDLTVANEACLIGIDPRNGFSGFTMKETDGVLSFHSCGFEAIGAGKYIAGSEFSRLINQLSLDQRREGIGMVRGLVTMCQAHIRAGNTFGHVGGTIRMVILDADSILHPVKIISNNKAVLLLEMVKAFDEGYLKFSDLEKMIMELLENKPIDDLEIQFFQSVSNFHAVEKMLRGYKKNVSDPPKAKKIQELYC